MKTWLPPGLAIWFVSAALLAAAVSGGDLPPPHTTGGQPLMQALAERQTRREFKPDPLTPQQMSDLLWAAFGINRPTSDHRTAPSARNAQEIDLYVARADGLYLYTAKPHQLRKVGDADLRRLTSGQDFAGVAPVALIYVADFTRFKDTAPEQARLYAAFDAGCVCQNVYLFAASEGLATVVHDLNREPLARAMSLRDGQHIILAQAVGWPR
jgi:nitroreductase